MFSTVKFDFLFYFGVGLGFRSAEGDVLIILPFVVLIFSDL